MFKRLFSAALVFGAAAIAPPAAAQSSLTCLSRDALVNTLQASHGERLTGGGLQNPARLIEVWSSDKTGSFTVFVTRADGMACVVATGQNWHSTVPKDARKGVTG
ncbi:MAG TPA: hypothetical protein EYP31_07190 [Roseibacterium sp.]|nr:hypothetical protein [Roseibacterium sp.]